MHPGPKGQICSEVTGSFIMSPTLISQPQSLGLKTHSESNSSLVCCSHKNVDHGMADGEMDGCITNFTFVV